MPPDDEVGHGDLRCEQPLRKNADGLPREKGAVLPPHIDGECAMRVAAREDKQREEEDAMERRHEDVYVQLPVVQTEEHNERCRDAPQCPEREAKERDEKCDEDDACSERIGWNNQPVRQHDRLVRETCLYESFVGEQ